METFDGLKEGDVIRAGDTGFDVEHVFKKFNQIEKGRILIATQLILGLKVE